MGGEKVHVKLTWELLTLVTTVSHGFEQRPFKLRKVDSPTDAISVTSPVCPALPPWRPGCLSPCRKGAMLSFQLFSCFAFTWHCSW